MTLYLDFIREEHELDVPQPEQVTRLSLSATQLVQFVGLQNLINLDCLILDSSIFSELPSVVRLLTNLKELHLNCTKLTFLDLGPLNLTTLCLGECGFTQLPDLQSQTQLTKLYIYQNKLTKIPSWIGTLPLQSLDLSRNNLSVFPKELLLLKSLEYLNLQWNNLTYVKVNGLPRLRALLLWGVPIQKLSVPDSLEVLFIDRPVSARLHSLLRVHVRGSRPIPLEDRNTKKVNPSLL